jgi:hypothetical protein
VERIYFKIATPSRFKPRQLNVLPILLNFGGWFLVLTKVIAGECLAVGPAIIAGHEKILQTEILNVFTLKS